MPAAGLLGRKSRAIMPAAGDLILDFNNNQPDVLMCKWLCLRQAQLLAEVLVAT